MNKIAWAYTTLKKSSKPLTNWWPHDSKFEVMVGAILVQNTSWRNVCLALDLMKRERVLTPEDLAGMSLPRIRRLIRSSGFYNQKAKTLKNFVSWYLDSGGYKALTKLSDGILREALLSLKGIGPETADDILLYAFDRPVFVVDAYTRRLMARLGIIKTQPKYEDLKRMIERSLATDVSLYKEFHALINEHAKAFCLRQSPKCDSCALRSKCPDPER